MTNGASGTKKIVLVLKTNSGGKWVLPQIRALEELGYRVTVVLPSGDGRLTRLLEHMKVPHVDSAFNFKFRPSVRTLRELLRLRRQLVALSPQIVFYHLYASALACRFATLGLGMIRVHMVPGPLYLDSRIISTVERVLCRLDHLLIGGSVHTARRYAKLGMPQSRTLAIPYGVDTDSVSPTMVSADRSVDAPDKFIVVMVAFVYAPKRAVHPGAGIKGHDLLVRAWVQFSKKFPDSQLVLVGGGFDDAGETHRQRLIHDLNISDAGSVSWLDSVDDVRAFYVGANLSVSPSLSENHGAALEASAMAVPSIVSDAGALPETVIEGETGWVVSAGNEAALTRALVEAHARWEAGELAKMGRRAREHAIGNFDQRECARRVADAIERVALGQKA